MGRKKRPPVVRHYIPSSQRYHTTDPIKSFGITPEGNYFLQSAGGLLTFKEGKPFITGAGGCFDGWESRVRHLGIFDTFELQIDSEQHGLIIRINDDPYQYIGGLSDELLADEQFRQWVKDCNEELRSYVRV